MSDYGRGDRASEQLELRPTIDVGFRLDSVRADIHDMIVQAADEAFGRLRDAKGDTLRELMDASGVRDMKGADLEGVDLRGEDLSGIDFEGANLTGADLRDCNLTDANFLNARLEGVRSNGAQGGEFLRSAEMIVRPPLNIPPR